MGRVAGDTAIVSFVFCMWPDFARLALWGTPGLWVPAEFTVDSGILSFQSSSLFALSHCLFTSALWRRSLPCSSCIPLYLHSWSLGSDILESHSRAPSHGVCALVALDDSSCWWKLFRWLNSLHFPNPSCFFHPTVLRGGSPDSLDQWLSCFSWSAGTASLALIQWCFGDVFSHGY